jgi:hypothetical protein
MSSSTVCTSCSGAYTEAVDSVYARPELADECVLLGLPPAVLGEESGWVLWARWTRVSCPVGVLENG